MKKVEFIEKLRRLEAEVGPKTSKALVELLEVEMNEFKAYIDQRFSAIDQRFSAIDQRFATLQWMLGLGFAALGVLIAVFN